MYDINNIFAKIMRKEIPSKIIFENDYVIAFNDVAPVAPVHILILPKGEFIDYADFIKKATVELMHGYFASIPQIAELVGAQNYRLVTNKGPEAGQSIFHFHIHLLAGTKMENIL